jgi:hypothetical protein
LQTGSLLLSCQRFSPVFSSQLQEQALLTQGYCVSCTVSSAKRSPERDGSNDDLVHIVGMFS